MKVNAYLSIGYPAADHSDIIEVPDDELEGLSEDRRDEVINEYVQDWADNYIQVGWKEI
jgi:hypothetical protein